MKPEILITEPATMLSDYLLGVWVIFLIHRIWEKRTHRDSFMWLMMASLGFSGFASFTGGTYHGFFKHLSDQTAWLLWFFAMGGIGLAGTCLLLATIKSAHMSETRRKIWWSIALFTGGIFVVAIYRETTLETLGLYYAPVVGAATWLQLYTWFHTKSEASKLFLAGVVIALISGAVQKYNIGYGEHGNGDVMCHFIFMITLYLFYRGTVATPKLAD